MLYAEVDPRLQRYCIVDGSRLHLKIHGVPMSDELLDAAIRAVRMNANITALTLSHLGCGPKMAVVVADMLEHKSSLTSCDLSGNSIGSHGSKCLSLSLHANARLRRLSLRQCNLGSDGIADWAMFIQRGRNTVLDMLDLSRNRIDDDGAAMLASALQQLKFTPTPTRKWRINLLGNAITDAGVAHLASAMKKCTVVTSIDVANSKAYGIEQPERVVFIEHCARRNTRQVAHQVAEEVVRAMAQSERKAEITRLEHVQLTEVDCVSLGHALRRSHATTHLVLRNNTLTLAGLRLFAPSLSVSMSLFSITLVDNNVGGDGLFALLMAIRDNSTEWPLRELHIINSTATCPTWPRRLNAHIYHTFVQGTVRLTALTLANCGLQDVDVAALVAGIAWGCSFERLNLARNHMTDHVLSVFQVLFHRCLTLQSLDVGGNQCTLNGVVDLVKAAVNHPRLHALHLGRFPCLDNAILRIDAVVQTSSQLRILEVSASHEHSKYAPVMMALRAKVQANHHQHKLNISSTTTINSPSEQNHANNADNGGGKDQHVRWCRMQYVARQVARDAIAWHLRPVTVLYVAEQLCMQRQDMNATVVLDTHAMTVNDWNVSLVWDLMVEVLCMHRCDLNVHIVYECLSMAGEDSRR
ncbi:hypothetical protein H257_02724 [Aphanomyces astaci]|uniref:Uncharacterized protein n=2 Tax=Aphanomyces astaci TaxID=112090 RepID=W4H2R3_APHAT|nr:hypothetical protein H257_02724 [Aphanomyces astaci]ETV86315.1 hypothetical protein H257_02724 [Aphanomyces astaci]|eukprot:XP_009824787.1 hypothetical protein H257_02724 [Aphanomyces astaci]